MCGVCHFGINPTQQVNTEKYEVNSSADLAVAGEKKRHSQISSLLFPGPPFLCKSGVMVYTHILDTMAEGTVAGGDSSVILLQPFAHQVGGHTRMHLLDPGTICKPLIARELNFYLNIPKEIQDFTPQFKGVIQVSTIDNTNVVQVKNMSTSSSSSHRNMNLDSESDSKSKKSKLPSSKEYLRVKLCSEGSLVLGSTCSKDSSSSKQEYFDDYWFKSAKQSNIQYFLLLENVASHFYRPCILDLKMGTRQHGDDAPEEKRHRHIAKCAASTSANLGVRLCGMQVYQADVGAYICKDKYYGRTLDEEGFRHALYQFFHNGFKLRERVLLQVIERLQQLRKAIEKQNSFRFFSSSLLILYEGCDTKDLSQCDDMYSDSESDMSSGAWACETQIGGYFSYSSGNDCDSMLESSTESDASSSSTDVLTRAEGSEYLRPQVDVRMIDFAHTTHEGYVGDSLVHRGPDNGYLLGLDSLIRLLTEVTAEDDEGKE